MRTPRGGRPAARLLFSLLALALLGVAPARAVAPNFTVIAPTGGQRGTSVELTLRGERLADAAEILFYDDGLKADKILSATDKEVKVLVRISPECPLGEHALRLRTASGLSALRIFYVGPFPNVEEKEPNNGFSSAMTGTSVICGVLLLVTAVIVARAFRVRRVAAESVL